MGTAYRQALPDMSACIPATVPIQIASGTMGRQLGTLHDWLYGQPPRAICSCNTGPPHIRGIGLYVTADEALAIARRAIDNDSRKSRAFHSWYVSIDDQQVAPKWLVHHLTGLPVSAFSTDQARRALTQMGIKVHRQ
jgi:hypothetical protein